MFMCRQIDNLWGKLIQKVGKEKVKVTFLCKNEVKNAFFTLFNMASCLYWENNV